MRERAGIGFGSEGWRFWEAVSGFVGGRRLGLFYKVMLGFVRFFLKFLENNNNNNKRKYRSVNCFLFLEICEVFIVCRIFCRVLGYNYGECIDFLEFVREILLRSKFFYVKWCRNFRERR